MKPKIKQVLATVASVAALTGATLLAGPATASAAPCGLSGEKGSTPPAGTSYYAYTIRNCHDYTVRRKVDISRGRDGACHTIGPHRQVDGFVDTSLGLFASPNGLKSC